MKRLAILLSILVMPNAFAATVSWTNPTAFTDGSPLVPADIASTTVEWSSTQAFTAVVGSLVVNGAATSTTAPPNPQAGQTLCYRARTTVVAAKGGGQSAPSNVSCKTAPFPNPNPPSLLDVILAFVRRVFGWFV